MMRISSETPVAEPRGFKADRLGSNLSYESWVSAFISLSLSVLVCKMGGGVEPTVTESLTNRTDIKPLARKKHYC